MPTVNVDQEYLFSSLGRRYSTEEFREICFQFGIELEEDTSELAMAIDQIGEAAALAQGLSSVPLYKIDVPANRYDLLSPEGIVNALNVFLNNHTPPVYKLKQPSNGNQILEIRVSKSTDPIRPFIVGAIIRNLKMKPALLTSFMALQDKLHTTVCRKRTLVAIGTHDLDKIQGPVLYSAKPPSEIEFQALNQASSMSVSNLFDHYRKHDKHISKYLPIIQDSPVYPVLTDAQNVVLSLPPIINGEHTKITLQTKNMFIECTGTNLTKLNIVLNTLIATYSTYESLEPYTIEPVKVIDASGKVHMYPNVTNKEFKLNPKYINSCIGIDLSVEQITTNLRKMGLQSTIKTGGSESEVYVQVPITRSDILHECDIMEDVAIAFGYQNIPKTIPKVDTIGMPLPINKLSDQIRLELSMLGFTEVLPLTLCAMDENYANLDRSPGVEHGEPVVLANPKTKEYQIVRTSLIPGILKTIRENKFRPLPLQVFEVSDIVLRDESVGRRARNHRRIIVAYANKNSGFEIIHGVMDRVMQLLNVNQSAYKINPSTSSTFFQGRQAQILYKDAFVGQFGILHPEVCLAFELNFPVTVLELELEAFL